MRQHPNATVATVTGALATLAVWLADRLLGYDLPKVYAAALSSAVVAAVLFVGRRGLRGTSAAVLGGLRVLWSGSDRVPEPPKVSLQAADVERIVSELAKRVEAKKTKP